MVMGDVDVLIHDGKGVLTDGCSGEKREREGRAAADEKEEGVGIPNFFHCKTKAWA
jgi:hypothetical protein